jgi:hypothetical protein
MNDCSHGRHCPFLNRADARCARHFSLEQLQHAFEHCFGQYEACGVYLELLYERRLNRAAARLQRHVIGGLSEQDLRGDYDVNTDPDLGEVNRPAGDSAAADPIVQVTIGGRLPQGAGHPPLVSHAPGV